MLLAAVAVVIAIHLLPGLDASRIENGIRNGLHSVLFGALAAVIYRIAPFSGVGKVVFTLLVVIVVGVSSEASQLLSGHTADPVDLLRDIAGATLVLGGILIFRFANSSITSHVSRSVFRLLGIGVMALAALPAAYWSTALLYERMLHPVVLDFDSRFSRYRYFPINADVILVESQARAADAAAELILTRRGRSGLAVQTAEYDWSDKQDLVFSAEVVNGSLSYLTVHVNDVSDIGHFADTAAGTVSLIEGKQDYRVRVAAVLQQTGRDDDVTNIRQLVILAREKQSGVRLRIDDIRLE
jgi:VanZ family protein